METLGGGAVAGRRGPPPAYGGPPPPGAMPPGGMHDPSAPKYGRRASPGDVPMPGAFPPASSMIPPPGAAPPGRAGGLQQLKQAQAARTTRLPSPTTGNGYVPSMVSHPSPQRPAAIPTAQAGRPMAVPGSGVPMQRPPSMPPHGAPGQVRPMMGQPGAQAPRPGMPPGGHPPGAPQGVRPPMPGQPVPMGGPRPAMPMAGAPGQPRPAMPPGAPGQPRPAMPQQPGMPGQARPMGAPPQGMPPQQQRPAMPPQQQPRMAPVQQQYPGQQQPTALQRQTHSPQPSSAGSTGSGSLHRPGAAPVPVNLAAANRSAALAALAQRRAQANTPPQGTRPPPQQQQQQPAVQQRAQPVMQQRAPPPIRQPQQPPQRSSGNGGSSWDDQPVSPSKGFGGIPPEAAIEDSGPLYPCHTCGRTFNAQALSKHTKVCEKVFLKKRKQFNVVEARVAGTEAAKYVDVKKGVPKSQATASVGKAKAGGKMAKWKMQSEQLRAAMKNNRLIVEAQERGEDIRSIPFEAGPAELDDRVSCPHCGRKFAPLTAERHIPHCKNTQAKPNFLKAGARTGNPLKR